MGKRRGGGGRTRWEQEKGFLKDRFHVPQPLHVGHRERLLPNLRLQLLQHGRFHIRVLRQHVHGPRHELRGGVSPRNEKGAEVVQDLLLGKWSAVQLVNTETHARTHTTMILQWEGERQALRVCGHTHAWR